jgi:diacylglycerol kinase family enzyme
VDAARDRGRGLTARPFLLVNPRAGDRAPTADDLIAAARKREIEARALGPDEDAASLARDAAERGASSLGVAGGDGSLAPVAAVALEAQIPFVPVPFGTRNHFSRDVGLDRDDPIAALDAFGGVERRVDVGLVQGRLFLNNVSLGLYASLVHDPDHETKNRLVATARLVPAAFGRARQPLELVFEANGKRDERRALVCLVANNGYELAGGLAALGGRPKLDEGRLYAYVIEASKRRTLLALLGRAAAGRLERARGWTEWAAPSFRIEARRPRVHAAIDGEPAVLEPPIELEIRPRALRILLPTRLRDGATEDPSRT